MKKSELIETYHEIEETIIARTRLGEYNADAKTILQLLNGTLTLLEHAIENFPEKKKP